MGLVLGVAMNQVFGGFELQVLVVGLDNAGKTTVFRGITRNVDVKVEAPALGLNVGSVRRRNVTFNLWDLNGQERHRASGARYVKGADGIVFVVDSSDLNRLDEAREQLER